MNYNVFHEKNKKNNKYIVYIKLFLYFCNKKNYKNTQLEKLKSIQPIIKKYDTQGSSPILVMANDLNQWVCKYKHKNQLFNELLAYQFAKIWQINIPECALIEIDYEKHIKPFNEKRGLERRFFERECFGSLFLHNAIEVNKTILIDKNIVRRIKNKNDLLKIALFDIWLSNEDRTTNNYNLLLQAVKGGYSILYIIDNTEIFNSSMAYSQYIELITQVDSVLNSDLATLIFKNDTETVKEVNTLLKEFPVFTKKCQDHLQSILNQVPQQWHIDLQKYETKIDTIFTENWLKNCENTFREYTQTSIIHKP